MGGAFPENTAVSLLVGLIQVIQYTTSTITVSIPDMIHQFDRDITTVGAGVHNGNHYREERLAW